MNSFNLWLGMSQAFQADLVPLVNDGIPATAFPVLNQLDDVTLELFRTIYDADGLEQLFKMWPGNGKDFRVWSFYFSKPLEGPQIHSDIDATAATYPQDFLPMGAWRTSDGGEVGTPEWFPVPPQIVNFMPDVWNGDEPPTYSPATVPTDVNLLFGQAPRDFGSFYV
jgi:hypothetical protein